MKKKQKKLVVAIMLVVLMTMLFGQSATLAVTEGFPDTEGQAGLTEPLNEGEDALPEEQPPETAEEEITEFETGIRQYKETPAQKEGDSKELTKYRSEKSMLFENPDGTMYEKLYATPIFFTNQDNQYVLIDNSVVATKDGGYTNAANEWNVVFSDIQPKENPIQLSGKNATISFGLCTDSSVPVAKLDNHLDRLKLGEEISKPNSVIYQDVLPDVDVTYSVLQNGIKENIILKSPSAGRAFDFRIQLNGLTAVETKDGRLVLTDAKGTEIIEVKNLYAIDANGEATEKVISEIVSQKGDELIIRVSVDGAFLKDAAYPVILDPSFVWVQGSATADSHVNSINPTHNYYLYQILSVGCMSGIDRTYIRFSDPNVPSNATITNALLYVSVLSEDDPGTILAHRVESLWNSNQITWNSQPGYNTSTDVATGVAANSSHTWYYFNVTNWIKKFQSTTNNYGFVLRYSSEVPTSSRWHQFRSSDHPDLLKKPFLKVDYTAPQKNVTIQMVSDETLRQRYPTNSVEIMTKLINYAKPAFLNTWNINLIPNSSLNGSFYGHTCPLVFSDKCTIPTCGPYCTNNENTQNHHKNGYRNFYKSDDYPLNGNNISAFFPGFIMCSTSTTHTQDDPADALYGLAWTNGNYLMSGTRYTVFSNVKILQHELSHIFGCADKEKKDCWPGDDCIMSGGYDGKENFFTGDIWCRVCHGDFKPNRSF